MQALHNELPLAASTLAWTPIEIRTARMEYTTLGRTELKVSVAGLGCGGFSRLGLNTGGTEASAIAIIHAALDQA